MQRGVHPVIRRRSLLGGVAATTIAAAIRPNLARANAIGARFGAIRWDAWQAGSGAAPGGQPGLAVQSALGPSRYHARAPWFAVKVSENTLTINGNVQGVMDQEIAYAAAAGIRYWGFVWYGPTDAMRNGWTIYQSSATKANVKWCLVPSYDQFLSDTASSYAEYVGYFQQPHYEKVLTNRPLVYLFRGTDAAPSATVGTRVTELRAACAAAGVGDPYIVCMMGYPPWAVSDKAVVGGDAISAYAYQETVLNATYATLDAQVQAWWPTMAATGSKFIPLGMAGWDRRPRIETPMYWQKATQKPMIGLNRYYAQPTPSELADHLADCLTWMAANSAACEANSALIYAWNEHDEGGWICPTWTSGGADTSRLDAIGPVIS